MDFLLSLLHLTVAMATPYLLCTIGGVFVQSSGIFNMSLEGFITYGAFGTIFVTVLTGSVFWGCVAGILFSTAASMIMAFCVISKNGNESIVGLALNMTSDCVPAFIMSVMFGSRALLRATDYIDVETIPVDIPLLRSIPVLGDILNRQTPLTYLSFVLVFVGVLVMYKTRYGVYVRVAGENPEAASAIGINIPVIQYSAMLISAVLCSLAGINLSVENTGMFNLGISAGRGFICLSAITCGKCRPGRSAVFAFFFGFVRALQIKITAFTDSVVASLLGALPYVMIIIVLLLSELKRTRNNTSRVYTFY